MLALLFQVGVLARCCPPRHLPGLGISTFGRQASRATRVILVCLEVPVVTQVGQRQLDRPFLTVTSYLARDGSSSPRRRSWPHEEKKVFGPVRREGGGATDQRQGKRPLEGTADLIIRSMRG